jgi:hypothetical protein
MVEGKVASSWASVYSTDDNWSPDDRAAARREGKACLSRAGI